MVLSDRTIREELANGRLVIDPLDPEDIQPASVDVHIDRVFRVFKVSSRPYIDIREPMDDLTEQVVIEDERPFFIHPGEFVLASTREVLTLPDDILAQVEGKVIARADRAADPCDGGFRRSGLDGQADARAVERCEDADRTLRRHEDRAAQLPAHVDAGGPPVRQPGAPQQVPGADDADAEPRLHRVRAEVARGRPATVSRGHLRHGRRADGQRAGVLPRRQRRPRALRDQHRHGRLRALHRQRDGRDVGRHHRDEAVAGRARRRDGGVRGAVDAAAARAAAGVARRP